MTLHHIQISRMVPESMTYGGGAGAVASHAFSWGEWAAVTGAVVALLGLALQVWATLRRDWREQEAHRRNMGMRD